MEKLSHIYKQLSSGGMVFVLDRGEVIDPQAEAMLQALHSRSTGGIKHHLQVLEEKGAENFMEKFYVGYGHKSIGDCGSVTVFVEGISMLAAKAIQDWRLYSGQESSTRYVDFSQQKFLNPAGNSLGEEILEEWRRFYLSLQQPLFDFLSKRFPKGEDESEKIYQKAIRARVFDIARSFLPAGAATNIAWHMNLRQFADELMLLRHHPLAEVREIAEKTEEALRQKYPQSFSHKRYQQTEEYNQQVMARYYHTKENAPEFALVFDGIDRSLLENFRDILSQRPPKTELPGYIAACGVLRYEFLLDFGSFRDLQRHRAVVQRMPLLTIQHGFHPWYLNELPAEWQEKSQEFLGEQEQRLQKLSVGDEIKQYYIAMGYRVPCQVTGDLKALAYLVELRSSRFVHPTLVQRMLQMIESLRGLFSQYGLVIHQDPEPSRFDVKRGEHDIVMKDE